MSIEECVSSLTIEQIQALYKHLTPRATQGRSETEEALLRLWDLLNCLSIAAVNRGVEPEEDDS